MLLNVCLCHLSSSLGLLSCAISNIDVASPSTWQEWALKFTNKLERRVVGFVIASGGTSIEQRGGASSKGSGVSGKSVDDLLRDQLANYTAGAVYADE